MNTLKRWAPLTNTAITAAVNMLSPEAREYFEERAGIHQNEGDMPAAEAEALALEHTIALYPSS